MGRARRSGGSGPRRICRGVSPRSRSTRASGWSSPDWSIAIPTWPSAAGAPTSSRRIPGRTYLEIAAAGGGIAPTVANTRGHRVRRCARPAASSGEMPALGVTTIESKSGYGLDREHELRCCGCIAGWPVGARRIVPTFLGAHVVPAEFRDRREAYVALLVEEMIPRWRPRDWRASVTSSSRSPPSPWRRRGGFSRGPACRAGAQAARRSAHLGRRRRAGRGAGRGLGRSPRVRLRAGHRGHGRGRRRRGEPPLRQRCTWPAAHAGTPAASRPGCPVAVATDFNPGSAPSYHLPLALTLACTLQRMTPAEALKGATVVAAKRWARSSGVGSLEPGKAADFAVIDAPDVEQWLYHLRPNACRRTVAAGRGVWRGGRIAAHRDACVKAAADSSVEAPGEPFRVPEQHRYHTSTTEAPCHIAGGDRSPWPPWSLPSAAGAGAPGSRQVTNVADGAGGRRGDVSVAGTSIVAQTGHDGRFSSTRRTAAHPGGRGGSDSGVRSARYRWTRRRPGRAGAGHLQARGGGGDRPGHRHRAAEPGQRGGHGERRGPQPRARRHGGPGAPGQGAGANIQANSGAPGGGLQVRLRGVSTINGQTEPLYVVDGVIVSDVAIANGADAVTQSPAGGNPRHPGQPGQPHRRPQPRTTSRASRSSRARSAAAIYGSKAANGVVIITTKRGHRGQEPAGQHHPARSASTRSPTSWARAPSTTVDEAVTDVYGDPAGDRTTSRAATFDHEDAAGRPPRPLHRDRRPA